VTRQQPDPTLAATAIVEALINEDDERLSVLWDAATAQERAIFTLASGVATAVEIVADAFDLDPCTVLDLLAEAAREDGRDE
jgi:hypothetical protein